MSRHVGAAISREVCQPAIPNLDRRQVFDRARLIPCSTSAKNKKDTIVKVDPGLRGPRSEPGPITVHSRPQPLDRSGLEITRS